MDTTVPASQDQASSSRATNKLHHISAHTTDASSSGKFTPNRDSSPEIFIPGWTETPERISRQSPGPLSGSSTHLEATAGGQTISREDPQSHHNNEVGFFTPTHFQELIDILRVGRRPQYATRGNGLAGKLWCVANTVGGRSPARAYSSRVNWEKPLQPMSNHNHHCCWGSRCQLEEISG